MCIRDRNESVVYATSIQTKYGCLGTVADLSMQRSTTLLVEKARSQLKMVANYFEIRNGHTTSIAPHPVRSVKLSAVGSG